MLSRDDQHFPVFLPNERVDMKIVSNNKGDYRVAASAKRRYVKTLRIADRNIVYNIFDIYRLKEKDNEFLLIYKEYPIYIKIEVNPREIRKTYLYEDGKKKTNTTRL